MTSSLARVRILLVEDNPADVYLIRQALNEAPFAYELIVCPDGDDALQLLRGMGANGGESMPQMVLLDLNLPRVDGPVILDAIRAETRLQNLPIVLLSSSQEPRDKARAADRLELSGVSHLFKALKTNDVRAEKVDAIMCCKK